ncbi:hypothetical protein DSM43518_04151 [Mycobacterium marinum]|nr:hypothetical protein DSM43518_04151 [Mycobacterium marinum]
MVNGLDHFDQPGHSGRGLGMPHIGFHRTQPQRLLSIAIGAVGGQKSVRLNRIAQSRAGTVGLHHIHIGHSQPRGGHRRTDNTFLGRPIRRGQTIRRTILIDGATTNHCQHRMAIAAGIAQTLQQHQTSALAETGPIGASGKRFAPPIRR